jgi:hypothetical protein
LVSDSGINSYSDYHQELNLIYQEITGLELLVFQKMMIMVQVEHLEIENYLSSNTHGHTME